MRFEGFGDKQLKLAMLGMVEGNGHPYSWSAIFNGYDGDEMARCPYAAIRGYLDKQPVETLGIPGAQVTHIWTDDPGAAPQVAKASLIPQVVERPEDVIGQVDAVIVATDIGSEHVERCRPFVEADIPVFVDKPLVENAPDLEVFREWIASGKPILSSSAMRYAKEFLPYRISTHDLGELRFVTVSMAKSWDRYGIHALSAAYPITGPGFITARNSGGANRDIVHYTHERGIDVVIGCIYDMAGGYGGVQLCGTAGSAYAVISDTYCAFKSQLEAFVVYLRTGERPFPFSETEELMRMLIAGNESREKNGAEIRLDAVT